MAIARQQQGTMLTNKIQYETMLWMGSPMVLAEAISRVRENEVHGVCSDLCRW